MAKPSPTLPARPHSASSHQSNPITSHTRAMPNTQPKLTRPVKSPRGKITYAWRQVLQSLSVGNLALTVGDRARE